MWVRMGEAARLVGVHAGAAAAESSVEGPQKVKNGASIRPSSFSSGYSSEQRRDLEATCVSPPPSLQSYSQQSRCRSSWRSWRRRSGQERVVNRHNGVHSALGKKEILPFATARRTLEGMTLCERKA